MVDKPQEDGSTKKVFEAYPAAQAGNVTDENALQAVYLSSSATDSATTEPDIVRVADTRKTFTANGKLKSISRDDFKNTDIYVFRESTGQLVLERNGLKDEEVAGRVDIGLGKEDKYYYYRLMLRGPSDTSINVGAINRSKNWEEWAEEYRLAEPFRKREADYLKSGEWVRLVVINRATGYMGTQRIQLGDASKNAGSMLSVKLDDTYLQPPNLKIWAERDYTQTSGLEQNKQQKNNIIGMEGASLDTDDIIRVYTEWLDEDGRPLPEGLSADNGEQYGLTGRLAKVGSPNQLVGVAAGSLASFPIAPGMSTQVLRLKDNLTAPEHFYVHVVGMQKDENPDFGTDPTEAPPLDTRPKNATPFLVPIYDENKHWKTWSAWNQLQRAYDAEDLDEKPLKPKGSYVWHVRPEYQFSQLALEVQKIEREYTTESGETKTQELLVEQEDEGKIPTIRANDDLVRVFYSLIGNRSNPLLPIDGEQELVFGFGASEVRATIGANGEIVFKDLSHIDSLDPTDLLTLRLYVNHDAGNTLWEWAFTRNGLHVYYSIPGNTQEKSKRALPTIPDVNCTTSVAGKLMCSDFEILSLLAKEDTVIPSKLPAQQPDPKVRTLGGMRLRLRYIPPSLDGIKITKVTWKMGHKGRYCNQYGVTTAGCNVVNANQEYEQTHPYTPVLPTETGDWSVYWEPVSDDQNKTDWSNWAGTQTDDKGVASSLNAEYTIPVKAGSGDTPTSKVQTRRFPQDFTLHTRELKPATGTDKPMQGSDVAMLEAMLWQFGISPSNKYGYTASRIVPTSRNTYVSGVPSVEKMVFRLKNRLNETQTEKIKGIGSSQNLNIDNDTLQKIAPVWKDYIYAVNQHPNKPSYTVTDIKEAEWKAMENALAGSVAANKETFTISLKYTGEIHASAVSSYRPESVSIRDLLKAWVNKENDRHWGLTNAPYRISEGGADDVGSIGFSQVWFSYRYGKLNVCEPKKKLNLFEPKDNLLSFAVHVGASETGCDGSMYAAFETNRYGIAPQEETQKKLVGYLCEQEGVEKICPYSFGNYDRLVKGLIGYNAGTGADRLIRCSLPEMLAGGVEVEYIKRGKTTTLDCQSIRTRAQGLDYAMTILHNRMPSDQGGVTDKFLSIPHRTFVWVGERYATNLMLEDGITPDPNAGKPKWCFKYGEKEWREGASWEKARALGSDINEDGESKKPYRKSLLQLKLRKK